jgi:hypothetical protein
MGFTSLKYILPDNTIVLPSLHAGAHHKTGIIPPFVVPLSPEEQHAAIEEEKARLAAFQQVELMNMRRTIEDKLRNELQDVLASHHKQSLRDYLCCCLPRKQVTTSGPGKHAQCIYFVGSFPGSVL